MYAPEQLFIWRIDALRLIIENPSEANLFEAARFLRQILLDGADSLLFQVNRKIQEKVWFIVCDLTARPNPDHPLSQGLVFSSVADGIAPDPSFPMIPQKRIGLDEFLKQEVLHYKGQTATVRQIIKYVANKAGAVHKQQPDGEPDLSLEEAALTIGVGGSPSVLRNLKGIAQVTVTACEPLYKKLRI